MHTRYFFIMVLSLFILGVARLLPPLSLGYALASQENTQATEEAASFVTKISHDTLAILDAGDLTDAQKELSLTEIFNDIVNINWIARFSLGRHWNTINETQREDYMTSYHQYLLKTYVPRFKEYNGQTINITKTSALSEHEFLVETLIRPASRQSENKQATTSPTSAIQVNYRLRRDKDNKLHIVDIIAEGISLITAQRSEFNAIVSRGGINTLLEKLHEKIQG